MQTASFWPAKSAPVTAPAHRISTRLATLLVAATALSDYLFWQQGVGLNVLIYLAFLVGAHLALLPRHAPVRRAAGFWVAAGGCLLSGGLVAWYGSAAAQWAALASALLLLGLVNQPGLRLLPSAVGTAVAGVLPAVALVLGSLRLPRGVGGRLRRGWFYGRLLGLPLLALVVFQALFAVANPRYGELSARAWAGLGEWLGRFFEAISVPHLLFLGLCGVGAAGALVVVPTHFFTDYEGRFGEFVRRRRDGVASFGVRRPNFAPTSRRLLDLRKEWLAAVACFGLLNALLLVVNAVDVRWLWFGFRPAADFDLTQFVHEGTYLLIASILLAAGIMLWFFRRNLNFYQPGLPLLRGGATLWVAQNVVLAGSVGLRNYYYITYTGLAYKRIGVCFFLLLTLFGLGTVGLKIWQRRSAFSLFRLNAWAAYAVLLLMAAGTWEIWMARSNLQPRFRTLDIGFLLDMPPRVLPELLAHRAVLAGATTLVATDNYGRFEVISLESAQARLATKERAFRAEFPQANWQSRTVSEWWANRELNDDN